MPNGAAILLDTTVYVDQLKGDLPAPIIDLIATRPVHHGAPALSQLAATIGYLNPSDSRTAASLRPIIETLERVPPQMVRVPSDEAWIEASILAGILARTQAVAKADRRRLLNDALLFLTASESGAEASHACRHATQLSLPVPTSPTIKPKAASCTSDAPAPRRNPHRTVAALSPTFRGFLTLEAACSFPGGFRTTAPVLAASFEKAVIRSRSCKLPSRPPME